MKLKPRNTPWLPTSIALVTAIGLLTGCKSNPACCPAKTVSTATPPPTAAPASKPAPTFAAIRIKTGISAPFTDSSGNVWLADRGFADGDTVERPEVTVENTKDPGIYRAERYAMSSFSQPLPNGNYVVKLHFAETFEGINGPGQRVFSFNVEGKEFKDFDVWVKAGGFARAYVETVNVDIADGQLDVKFTPNIENPQINGIEIIPLP